MALHYVYAHMDCIHMNGTIKHQPWNIAYIGEGKDDRPYSIGRTMMEHKMWMQKCYEVYNGIPTFVVIISTHESKADAIKKERLLIERYSPRFNKRHNPKYENRLMNERAAKIYLNSLTLYNRKLLFKGLDDLYLNGSTNESV
jgi:hypothetical protein